MIWINENLQGGYELIGTLVDNLILLYINYNNEQIILKEKFITNIEADQITSDDLLQYFQKFIIKLKSKNVEQLDLVIKRYRR
jgi:hypothetical protein